MQNYLNKSLLSLLLSESVGASLRKMQSIVSTRNAPKKIIETKVSLRGGMIMVRDDIYIKAKKSRINKIINESQDIQQIIKTVQEKNVKIFPFEMVQQVCTALICQRPSSLVYELKWEGRTYAVKISQSLLDEGFKKVVKEWFQGVAISVDTIDQNLMILRAVSFDEELCLIYDRMKCSLRDAIDQEILNPLQKASIAFDICNGMNALHERKPEAIIHRNIKPSNILLDYSLQAYVTDFLKSFKREATSYYEIPQGLFSYLPPEAFFEVKIGKKADVWAFGCILIEMYSGRPLWPKQLNDFQIMDELTAGRGPASDVSNQGIMYHIQNNIKKCIQIKDHQRPNFNHLWHQFEYIKVIQQQELIQETQIFILKLKMGSYEGEVQAGLPHGKGTLHYKPDDNHKREKYVGEFFQGKRQGNCYLT